MFRRRALFLLLGLLFLPVVQAAALRSGDIVVLRAPSGLHLSAVPGERLALSPNTSAWEQWLYRDTPPYLVSFHGTGLVIGNPSARHTSGHAGDSGFHARLFGLASTTLNGVPILAVSGSGPLDGADVKISPTSSAGSTLYESGGQLKDGWCGGTDFKPCAWRVFVVSNPAPRPQALLQAARNERTMLLSTHNTWLLYSDPSPLPSRATHRSPRPSYISATYFPKVVSRSMADAPLLYGDQVRIWAKFPHPTMVPAPMVSLDYDLRFAVEGSSTLDRMWTITDPDGVYQAGARVPLGAKVCLHSTNSVGFKLQADPRTPEVKYSSNCAAWEWWTISNIE